MLATISPAAVDMGATLSTLRFAASAQRIKVQPLRRGDPMPTLRADLTAAEASVARELGAGVSVEQIADNGGVSVNTVRTQVRKIIEKTGCSRMPEVVSLISNLTLPH